MPDSSFLPPLQVDIPHLGPTGPEGAAARLLLALDEPRVRRKFLDPVEPMDVMNLVQDRQGQDLPNARDRAEPVKGIAVVALGVADDRQFEIIDEGIVLIDEHDVDLDALAHARIGEVLDDAVAIPGVRQAPTKLRQIVLGAGVLNLCQ
jgi:hypothetical protein